MGTISYKISSKINNKGESQIFIDILSDRTTHYRLKTGVYISPENYTRLIKSDRILSLEWFYRFDELITKALPCSKEEAQRIMEQAKGTSEDIMTVYDEFSRSRMIEKGLSDGTRDMYHSARMMLQGCLKGRCSVKCIDTSFLNEMIEYMCARGYTNVTQLNYWRLVKVFLTYLVKNNMIDQKLLLYKPKFRVVDNDVIYLTHNELYRMYGLELKGKDRIIRDAFLVQCFTGMRHSDMVNIRKENIQEDANGKYISILTKKTTQRLKIYFNTTAEEILENYDWNLPWYSRDVMNIHLKNIAKEAHIEGEVERVSYVGNRRMVEKKKKYECVTTHCARRTFICLCIENGVSTPVIQSVTGHRQLSSFQRYVGIADKSKSDMVAKLEI